jgi:hypothetical protein
MIKPGAFEPIEMISSIPVLRSAFGWRWKIAISVNDDAIVSRLHSS